jgi:signal transduction histidine kinase
MTGVVEPGPEITTSTRRDPGSSPDPTRRASTLGYAALAVAATGLSVTALIVLERDGNLNGGDWVSITLIGVFVVAGVALARRAPTHPLGIMALVAVVAAGVAYLASADLRGGHDSSFAQAVESIGWAVVLVSAFVLLLSLPDGRLSSRGARFAVRLGGAAAGATGLLRWSQHPDPPSWPLFGAALVLGVVGFGSANRRYVTARGAARQRMQWLGLAVALCAETVLVVVGLHVLLDWPPHPTETSAASLVLVAAALTAAATPSFVGRIDRLLSHVVSAAGLTAVVTIIYFIVVVGLGRVPTDDDKNVLVLSMVAAAACALVYPVAKARLAEAADQLVYGRGHDPSETLENFGARLTRAVPMDELLLQLAEQCRTHLELRAAEIWTGAEGRLGRTTSVPERSAVRLELGREELAVLSRARVSGRSWAEVWAPKLLDDLGTGPVRVVPLVHTGELFGVMVLERPEAAEDFTPEEDRTLTELARQIALALHNSELDTALQATLAEVQKANVELKESRARLVAAADLERRRIERDLHDGAQQNLVALAVKLRLIQRLAESDVSGALGMVEEARTEALATVEELRALAHGIYPPLLMDRGLGDALTAVATRALVPTKVEADGIGRYREDIEAAVYFCCLEALQNAGKHAGDDASIVIKLEQQGRELTFSVSDDGVGFDLDMNGAGHGFVNMADRVGAIGGSVEVWSQPGRGTRVSGCIPVDSATDGDRERPGTRDGMASADPTRPQLGCRLDPDDAP